MGSLRAVALALILVPAVASAQSAKDKQKASELVKQAIAKSQSGDHETAVKLYEDAYKIIPQPLLLSNIGSEYQAMDKPVQALGYFCKYMEADPTGNNVSFAIAQAKTLYMAINDVTEVEDEAVCKPYVKPVEPKLPDPSGGGTTGGGTTGDPLPSPGPEPVDAPKSSSLRWVGVGVGVLGAGVFGLGVFYGLKAKNISDDISGHDPNDPWPGNINQLEADGASYEKKQIGFMIGGGVALAAGVTLFIVGGPKARTERTVSITPVATPDTLGFAAAGRF